MKKIKKTFLICLVILSLILSQSFAASAYVKIGSYQLSGGVGQSGNKTRYYWYDTNSFDSTWQSRVNQAMSDWCHTGSQGCGVYTSVWFKRTTTKSSSVVDCYSSNSLGTGVLGVTSFYKGTGSNSVQIAPSKSNWVWAKIMIATSRLDKMNPAYTNAKKIAVIEHEIGHAFGLDENNSKTGSIMCQTSSGRTAVRPSADDCNGVNSIYGGYNP